MRCDRVSADAGLSGRHCDAAICGCGSRRTMLRSAAAFGASAVLASAVWAQDAAKDGLQGTAPPAEKPHRIDVHHHFFPPFMIEEWNKANVRIASPARNWTLAKTLDQMDRGGVATAILSVQQRIEIPGMTPDAARGLTRRINDYAAQQMKEHVGRFGLFAFMPMPDVEGTLAEIEYALDVLKADGIGLLTSYENKWLGDPAFRPVLEELNRRKALVYVHPLSPRCCGALMSYVPTSFTEYPQDTNRTVMSLLFSGTFSRMKDITWIFSHGGAAVPLLAGRVAALTKFQIKNLPELIPNGIDYELKRLYYETANAAYAPNMAALLTFVPVAQVMFGTDYPYVSVTDNVSDLLGCGLTAAQLKAIDNDNAMRLMPRLKV
jgi:predicted TIM-barrel fold metal-dependent hydrolase